MGKNFGTVKKGTTLLLTMLDLENHWNKVRVGQVIATVTNVEIHGNNLQITYRGEYGKRKFTHTTLVGKDEAEIHVKIPTKRWSNMNFRNIQWSIKYGYLREGTLPEKSRRQYRQDWNSPCRYNYLVEVLY